MQKSEYELVLETPLITGDFVRDLIGTNKPGSKWAEAALVAAADCNIRDMCRCINQAIVEHAESIGRNPNDALMNAVWAQLEQMDANPIVPKPKILHD